MMLTENVLWMVNLNEYNMNNKTDILIISKSIGFLFFLNHLLIFELLYSTNVISHYIDRY